MTQSSLSKALIMPKSSICEHMQTLCERGLVSQTGRGPGSLMAATSEGERLALGITERALGDFEMKVRETSSAELNLFAGLATKIIAGNDTYQQV